MLPSSKTFLRRDVTNRLRGYLLSEVEVYQAWGGGGGGGTAEFVCLSQAKREGSVRRRKREGGVSVFCVFLDRISSAPLENLLIQV